MFEGTDFSEFVAGTGVGEYLRIGYNCHGCQEGGCENGMCFQTCSVEDVL